jgi:hypothetical protein
MTSNERKIVVDMRIYLPCLLFVDRSTNQNERKFFQIRIYQ